MYANERGKEAAMIEIRAMYMCMMMPSRQFAGCVVVR